ncbi:MAG: hypothetical protein HKN20_06230, partial [Gemmatimonadetes bacterium]|nr:hypothetical protein [Gemmatimonadota bacterium]
AVFVGMRALTLYEDAPRIKKTGVAILGITGFQFLLGFAALAAVGVEPSPGEPTSSDLWMTTLHQAVGAVLVAHAVMLYAWTRRAIEPAGDR